eukprot:TRINITY_DN40589_c0_g1_i1.p1 TRINITY_DN40589_c0_g1~~TRINITY_DN40589_c0_g1_i1.p1  ORF type:complete len:1129 (+),score=273.74 TRINITY_DN40589_c0_g1_i1:56-3388(+)
MADGILSQLCRSQPQLTSTNKTNGVYGAKQSGGASHPSLRHRQQQRQSLRQSASMLLSPVGGKGNTGTRLESDGATQKSSMHSEQPRALSDPALAGRKKWPKTSLFEEMPLRLEVCKNHLAAADMELEHATQYHETASVLPAAVIDNAEPTSEPSIDRLESPPVVERRSRRSTKRDLNGSPSRSRIGSRANTKSRRAEESTRIDDDSCSVPEQPSQTDDETLHSSNVASTLVNEPAPEPMDMLESDEDLEAEEAEAEELNRNIVSVEAKLANVGSRWLGAEQERRQLQEKNLELSRDLDKQSIAARILDERLNASESQAQGLQKSLTASEAEAKELRAVRADLSQRLVVTLGQAKTLTANLVCSQRSIEALRDEMNQVKLAREVYEERARDAESDRVEAIWRRDLANQNAEHQKQLAVEAQEGNMMCAEETRQTRWQADKDVREAQAAQAHAEQEQARAEAEAQEAKDTAEREKREAWEASRKAQELAAEQAREAEEAADKRAKEAEEEFEKARAACENRMREAEEACAAEVKSTKAHAAKEIREAKKDCAAKTKKAQNEAAKTAQEAAEAVAVANQQAKEAQETCDRKTREAEESANKRAAEAEAEFKRRTEEVESTFTEKLANAEKAHQKVIENLQESYEVKDAERQRAREREAQEAQALVDDANERREKAETDVAAKEDQIVELKRMVREAGGFVPLEGSSSAAGATSERAGDYAEADDMHIPMFAAVPELLHSGFITGDDDEDDVAMKPTRCQVDTGLHELRLTPFGAIGPMQRISLKDVTSIGLAESGYSITVGELALDVDLALPGSDKPQKLRLAVMDEPSASALLGALTMVQRTLPGTMLATPQASATPSPRKSGVMLGGVPPVAAAPADLGDDAATPIEARDSSPVGGTSTDVPTPVGVALADGVTSTDGVTSPVGVVSVTSTDGPPVVAADDHAFAATDDHAAALVGDHGSTHGLSGVMEEATTETQSVSKEPLAPHAIAAPHASSDEVLVSAAASGLSGVLHEPTSDTHDSIEPSGPRDLSSASTDRPWSGEMGAATWAAAAASSTSAESFTAAEATAPSLPLGAATVGEAASSSAPVATASFHPPSQTDPLAPTGALHS